LLKPSFSSVLLPGKQILAKIKGGGFASSQLPKKEKQRHGLCSWNVGKAARNTAIGKTYVPLRPGEPLTLQRGPGSAVKSMRKKKNPEFRQRGEGR